MKCPGCELAESEPSTPIKYLGCKGCSARALASEPAFHESAELKEITPRYRAILQKVFRKDWQEGHRLVKKWADRWQEPPHVS